MTIAASSRITWRVWCSVTSTLVEVCGFLSTRLEREHVEKHFFARREGWSPLAVAAGQESPAALEARIAETARHQPEVAPPHRAAAVAYVETVRHQTTGQSLSASRRGFELAGNGHRLPRLLAVSQRGVFCAFALGRTSQLVTAYRPAPGNPNRIPTDSERMTVALRRLNDYSR